MLAVGKNIDQTSYHQRRTFLPLLLTTLRQYGELNSGPIFEYYYGYLCIQHVIHTICIAALVGVEMLEDLVENRNRCQGPCCADLEFMEALADRALYFITQTPLSIGLAQPPTYFGVESLSADIFPSVGGLSYEDLDFLLMTLWNDRCRLTGLVKRGMLPGLSALLFAVCHMMMCSESLRSTRKWVMLQDLIARLILFESQSILEERRLLQFVWSQRITKDRVHDSCVDEKDSRAIVRAYTDMFRPSSNEARLSLLQTMWIEPSSILFQFVCSHAGTKAPDLLPEIQQVAIERLWLELDEEKDGYATVSQSHDIIVYSLDIFAITWGLQRSVPTPTARAFLANIFLKVDLFDIFGRILLLALRDDSRPDIWKQLQRVFCGFFSISEEALSKCGHSLKDSFDNWGRVNDHLKLRKLGMTPGSTTSTYVPEAMQLWEAFCYSPAKWVWAKMCVNPRCPGFVMIRQSDAGAMLPLERPKDDPKIHPDQRLVFLGSNEMSMEQYFNNGGTSQQAPEAERKTEADVASRRKYEFLDISKTDARLDGYAFTQPEPCIVSNEEANPLVNLQIAAHMHRKRYALHNTIEDLDAAIESQNKALTFIPPDNLARLSIMDRLGILYWTRISDLNKLDDMRLAQTCFKATLNLAPEDHPKRCIWLNGLASVYMVLFSECNQLNDLNEAIGYMEQAILYTPEGMLFKAAVLSNLGDAFLSLFGELGRLEDLGRAINCGKEAITLTPDNHPDKYSMLWRLSDAYQTQFDVFGELESADNVAVLREHAMRTIDNDHPAKSVFLNKLSGTYQTLFERREKLGDLEKAIQFLEQA
ncbi:hypothetical protein FRC12_017169, partial [Ceratobasidium sp. 428]